MILKAITSLSKNVLLTIIALIFSFSASLAQNKYLPNPAFRDGEKITYTVFYNVIGIYVNAGTAVFQTNLERYNNTDVYHVVAEGRTNKKYDWIFKVRDRYESYFDTEKFRSLRFVRNIHEGDFKHHEEIVFQPKKNLVITNDNVYHVPSSIMDVINAVFYARNIDYNAYRPGAKISFNIFLDGQVYNSYVRYLGKERVTTKYGTYQAIKLKPLLIEGSVFKDGENMTLWVTDDARHVPVRAESPISVGSIKIDMANYTITN
ncbi:MAG TPA: DUF3108 domain-containing protein [Flavipsychrobacter sp.]|jgi:hypothetical protein|nr:DUF3108 domain-containing protein [Flavipsychrobacter sp.]